MWQFVQIFTYKYICIIKCNAFRSAWIINIVWKSFLLWYLFVENSIKCTTLNLLWCSFSQKISLKNVLKCKSLPPYTWMHLFEASASTLYGFKSFFWKMWIHQEKKMKMRRRKKISLFPRSLHSEHFNLIY